MSSPISGKHILLGVTGSIACYKAADFASKLAQEGAKVDCVLTESALNFISPLTFQSVTGRQCYTDSDLWGNLGHVKHIELGQRANLVIVAPATANTIAKLANGLADNLLTVSVLAATCPIVIAPAMDGGMFSNSATQTNLRILRDRGSEIVGPVEGHLASGQVGIGRMVEPIDMVGHTRMVLGKTGPLEGRKLVVTAAGTREPIDPVRSISNRSSGKQGFALAQAAIDRGGQVTLISGPSSLSEPIGARRVDVITAEDMLDAVLKEIIDADVLLMAAAVADFKPSNAAPVKIKKSTGIPEIQLQATPDILAQVAEFRSKSQWRGIVVGFAAESKDLVENARIKLDNKSLDLIAANDISAEDAGFDVDTNRITLLYPDGLIDSLPLMSKFEAAETIIEKVMELIPDAE